VVEGVDPTVPEVTYSAIDSMPYTFPPAISEITFWHDIVC